MSLRGTLRFLFDAALGVEPEPETPTQEVIDTHGEEKQDAAGAAEVLGQQTEKEGEEAHFEAVWNEPHDEARHPYTQARRSPR